MTRSSLVPLGFLAFSALALTGCDSPSPRMMGAAQRTVTVDGSTFGVHWNGEEAEVYRTSPELMPRLSEVFAKAEKAIGIASGCAVVPGSLAGDAALITARIDCG